MEVKHSGKVIGQLSTITKQSEQGATEAMGQLEKSIAAAELAAQEWEKIKSLVPAASRSGLDNSLAGNPGQSVWNAERFPVTRHQHAEALQSDVDAGGAQ